MNCYPHSPGRISSARTAPPLADSREKWLEDFPRESGEIYSSLLTVRGGDGYERQLEITALVPEDNADELIGCVLSADAVQRASSL